MNELTEKRRLEKAEAGKEMRKYGLKFAFWGIVLLVIYEIFFKK